MTSDTCIDRGANRNPTAVVANTTGSIKYDANQTMIEGWNAKAIRLQSLITYRDPSASWLSRMLWNPLTEQTFIRCIPNHGKLKVESEAV